MTEGGVDVVGEVERRGAARQVDHLALGRERVDTVLEQLAAHALDEVAFGIRLSPPSPGSSSRRTHSILRW